MIKRITIYILLLILGNSLLLGQNITRKIDSLDVLIKSAKGKEKVDLLNIQSSLYPAKLVEEKIKKASLALSLSKMTQSEYKKGMAESYNNLGVALYQLKNQDSSLILLRKAKQVAIKINEPKVLGKIYNDLGNTYELSRNYDSANLYHEKSLAVRRAISDSAGIASSLVNLGLNNWRVGKYLESNQFYVEALEIRRKLGDPHLLANILNNIGILNWNWGNYARALQYYLESYEMREKGADSNGAAITGNNIALLYQKLGDNENAYKHLTKALEIARKVDYKFAIGYSLENIGLYYYTIKEYDKALEYLEKGLEIYNSENNIGGITDANNKLGDVYFVREKYKEAIEHYEKALELALETTNRKATITSLNNLGKVYLSINEFDKAKAYLFKNLEMLKDDRMPDFESDAYGFLSKLYYKQGDLKNAYFYLQRHKQLSDSLFNSENSRNINEFKEKYESERKEKENKYLKHLASQQEFALNKQNMIILLITVAFILTLVFSAITYRFYLNKKKNALEILRAKEEVEKLNKELRESEKNLKEINTTKDRFFSILAHDLKNPFQSILAFSEILEEEYTELPEDEIKKMLGLIKESTKETYHLLENLLLWARTQRGSIKISKSNILINELINSVLVLLNNSLVQKSIKIDINEVENHLVYSDKYILETVFRNLLANAVKYSHKSGEIKMISTKPSNDTLTISIKDSGVGMDEETINGLFKIDVNQSTPGTNNEKGTGLGLIICNEYLNLLGGTIEVQSEPGKGSTFTIKLPVE